MTIKNFVFWQDGLSIHQSAFLRNLASHKGIEVILISYGEAYDFRKKMGWFMPDFGTTKIIIKPNSFFKKKILSYNNSNTYHIFSGTRLDKDFKKYFHYFLYSKAFVGIQSESFNDKGIRGYLRLIRSKYDSARIKENINFILAIGNLGEKWFEASGYKKEKIYPFGYFVETPSFKNESNKKIVLSNNYFEIIFIGQLIRRKGLDILIKALSMIKSKNWRLHVVGDGKDKNNIMKLCRKLGLESVIKFYGTMRNNEALHLLRQTDLLVLPSRWDGWGAVVNESLMCGVPAVCSDKCGASDLLRDQERGETFPSLSKDALSIILKRRIDRGKKKENTRKKILEWAQCINGLSAADYFLKIADSIKLKANNPKPPWIT